MPDTDDNRELQLQSIIATPLTNSTLKMRGASLLLASLELSKNSLGLSMTSSSAIANSSSASVSSASDESDDRNQNLSSTTTTTEQTLSSNNATNQQSSEQRFLLLVSEYQAKLIAIPSTHALKNDAPTDHHHQHHHQAKDNNKHQTSDWLQKLLTSPQDWVADVPLAFASDIAPSSSTATATATATGAAHACKAAVVQMRTLQDFNTNSSQTTANNNYCLVVCSDSGQVLARALPHLSRLLLEPQALCAEDSKCMQSKNAKLTNSQVALTHNGHCLVAQTDCELTKLTISSSYKSLLNEMRGNLFTHREMPEMPRANFFKSLFSVNACKAANERDELFSTQGSTSNTSSSTGDTLHSQSIGNPLRAAAHRSAAAAASSQQQAATGAAASASGAGGGESLEKIRGSLGHEMRIAREGLDERGEKLSAIEDRTLALQNQSESYASAAHQLAQKFKDKKWYQF